MAAYQQMFYWQNLLAQMGEEGALRGFGVVRKTVSY
jgi:hypothetical protein